MSSGLLASEGLSAPLTRADVRDEVRSALAVFAEGVLRRELEQLGSAVREDLRRALGDLEALRASAVAEGSDDAKGAQKALPGRRRFRSSTPSGSQGSTSHGSTASGAPSSPSTSPFSLPPSLAAEGLDAPTPLVSPVFSPTSAPDELAPPVLSPPSLGRKDWRRSFVEKATKANRKVEYLQGFQCKETHEVHDVMEEANKALEDGIKPHLVEDGLGGTYFVKDRTGRCLAVFKPRDEEPLAPNNPKVHAGGGHGAGLKEGVLVGEAAINEYVAYLLDQASSPPLRAGVCPTALVCVANSVFHSATEGRHSAFRSIKDKVGSFQLFAQHDCTSEDVGRSLFPVDQVHRIAALDIRLCNTDRHSGNVLVRRQGGGEVSALVPIDHGYALPGEICAEVTFEWLSWPASKVPFSEALRHEILAIDPDAVEVGLRKRVPPLRNGCLRTLRTCTRLLQIGVEAGLTAHDIGSLMTRPDESADSSEEPSRSVLELVLEEASASAAGGRPWVDILDELLRERCREAVGRPQT